MEYLCGIKICGMLMYSLLLQIFSHKDHSGMDMPRNGPALDMPRNGPAKHTMSQHYSCVQAAGALTDVR